MSKLYPRKIITSPKISIYDVVKYRLISNEEDSEFCLLKWLFKYIKRFWLFLNFFHILFIDPSRFKTFVIGDLIWTVYLNLLSIFLHAKYFYFKGNLNFISIFYGNYGEIIFALDYHFYYKNDESCKDISLTPYTF